MEVTWVRPYLINLEDLSSSQVAFLRYSTDKLLKEIGSADGIFGPAGYDLYFGIFKSEILELKKNLDRICRRTGVRQEITGEP